MLNIEYRLKTLIEKTKNISYYCVLAGMRSFIMVVSLTISLE